MTRRLSLLVAAIAVYDIVAFKTRRVPTITHIVHVTRLHFRPARPCPTCGLVPHAANRRTSWHTSVPS